MKSRPVTVVLAVLACVLGSGACARFRAGDDAVRMHHVAAPADVGRIVCETNAIRIETPEVRAFADGVHFVLENPGDVWGLLFHPRSWDYGQAEGVTFHDDVMDDISAMPPGSVTVACLPTSRASYDDPEAATATISIVDPDGLYVPWNLTCGFGEQFRMRIPASDDSGPTDVLRRVPGVLLSDELRSPNFPESPQHWPTFVVDRDGEAIARIQGPWIDGSWELIVNACPGSGIAGA
jgi:hypothetical protein